MLAALLFPLCVSGVEVTHRDTVHLDQVRQTIDHFGASDCWTIQTLTDWSPAARSHIADLLFSTSKGIGLSCWRFNIGGGKVAEIGRRERTVESFEVSEGQYDWSKQRIEQEFLFAAKARGVKQFLAFTNSPPKRMTRNGLTFGVPGKDTTNLKPGYEGQFARYLADIVDHFRKNPDPKERITFNWVSPINEPQWGWQDSGQEGSRASNDDIAAVGIAVAREFKKRRLPTKLHLVESGQIPDMVQLNASATRDWGKPYGNYIDVLLANPELAEAMDHRIGYHSYWSDYLNGPITRDRVALRKKLDEHPGWKAWQTEYCVMQGPEGKGGHGRDLTMKTAIDVARVIHADLTIAEASAWSWWLALSPGDYKDGLLFFDSGVPDRVIPSKLFWVMGNYSRFVRPGMRRVALAGPAHDLKGVLGSAYVDAKGRNLVMVYINASTEAQTVDWQIANRTRHVKSVKAYVTSDSPGDDLAEKPPTNTLLPRSVTTFVVQL